VGSPLPLGVPDLVRDLIAGLADVGKLPVPMRVELLSPRRAFQPLFRQLLDALARAGATMAEPTPCKAQAAATSDLGQLQRALLDPTAARPKLAGDGSLLLLDHTPLEAAELTASLARTRPLADSTFLVATEPATLDAALARQGLPTLGLPSSSHLRPHLQLLPLRLALAFRPQVPFRAAELLLLPGGPLPGHAQRALLGALNRRPGIGSPAGRGGRRGGRRRRVRHAARQSAANKAADERRAIDAGSAVTSSIPAGGILPPRLRSCARRWASRRASRRADAEEDEGSPPPRWPARWRRCSSPARPARRSPNGP
jgi:hypothetical protein